MATNIYDYEETIYFDPKTPKTYYGWFISTSSDELKVAHLSKERKAQMISEVESLGLDNADTEILAACTLIMSLGGSDSDADFAHDLMIDELQDNEIRDKFWQKLRDIGDDYSINYDKPAAE